jgi:hypothetical protein
MQEAESMAAELLEEILSSDSATIATGQLIDRESVLRTARNHLRRVFRVIWPQIRDHEYIVHEKTVSFEVDGHTIWVRSDLCTRDPDGNLTVIDWKTTSSDPFERESIQLLVYGLWAYHAYEPDFSRIKVQLAHTADGNLESFPFGESEYQQIHDVIDQETTYWSTHDAPADYPPKPKEAMCEACSYLDECEAGQELLSD